MNEGKQYTIRANVNLYRAYADLDPIFNRGELVRRVTGLTQYERVAIRPRAKGAWIDILEEQEQDAWAGILRALNRVARGV